MNQGRVQVAPLQTDLRLRPAPIQSDTFAPPPTPSPNQNAARLADALGAFSGTIGNLVTTAGKTNRDAQEQAAWIEQRKMAGKTREEWAADVQAGRIPVYEDKVKAAAINAAAGINFGAHRADQVKQQMLTSFDWDTQDPDKFISGIIQTDLDQFGQDKHLGANYLRQMDQLRNWSVEYREKRRADQFVEAQSGAAFAFIDTNVDGLTKADLPPEQIAKAVQGWYRDLGKDGTLGVDYKALDQEVMNKAARIAETSPEVALALLETPRTGTKGDALPSIANKRETRDRYLQIKDVARKAIDENAYKAGVTDFVTEGVEALRHGGFEAINSDKTVTLPSGAVKKLSKADYEELVQDRYFQASDATAKLNRETDAERIRRETRDFSRAHSKNPRLAAQLDGLSESVDLGVLQDPEAFKRTVGKLDAYANVKTLSEGAIMTNMPKSVDREFAEAFLAARSSLRVDDKRALEFAIATNRPVSADNLPRVQKFQQELDGKVKDITDTTYGWDPEVANYSEVYNRVATLAQRYVAIGLEPTKAIEVAAKTVQGSSAFYNGTVVGNVNGAMPADFQKTTDAFLDEAAKSRLSKKIGQGDLERKNLGIRAVGTDGNRFVVIDAEDGIPVADDDGDAIYFGLKQMRDYDRAMKDKADAEKVENVKKQQQDTQRVPGLKRRAQDQQRKRLFQEAPLVPSINR